MVNELIIILFHLGASTGAKISRFQFLCPVVVWEKIEIHLLLIKTEVGQNLILHFFG